MLDGAGNRPFGIIRQGYGFYFHLEIVFIHAGLSTKIDHFTGGLHVSTHDLEGG
jgi:hypothetical protein